MIEASMPSPNGKCASPGDAAARASRRRKAEGADQGEPSVKRRSDQPSTSRKPGAPRSAQKTRKPKESDGVFDAIFNLMDSSRPDNKKSKSSPKSPTRDRPKQGTSSDTPQPKFVSLQTRDDLMRHDSDNRMCYEFLRKEGLMERLLGHKMLKGRIEPYSYLGFVRKEPLHKPLPPEVFTKEFTDSCTPKAPPGPRTPPGPGPQTPSGSPGHSSGHSSPVPIANGNFEQNGIESPKKCTTPPPPPPILLDGEETEKDSVLRQMSQLTDTPVDKLETYFGKDLQDAMGKHDKETLLAKLKGALKEMTHSDSEKEENNNREGTVAMDIASDASDNSATIDDDEQRYQLSPLLLPPPPAPATPPPAPSSPPPPPPPVYSMHHQHLYAAPPGPAYQHYQTPAPLYSQAAPLRAPEYAPPQLPPPMYAPPPHTDPNYGRMPPPIHSQPPPPHVNYGTPMPQPPQLPTQHLLPPPPPAPLQYAVPPPPVMINTSLPPPNMGPGPSQQVQHTQYAPPPPPPPVNLSCPPPPPVLPPLDISLPPPPFSMNHQLPPPPMPQPPPKPMNTPMRFTEPPPPVTPAYRPPPGPAQPLMSVTATPKSANGVKASSSNSTPVGNVRNKARAGNRGAHTRPSLSENNSKSMVTETERRANLERNVQEVNTAVASSQTPKPSNPTEGNVMKTLWNALSLPASNEEKDPKLMPPNAVPALVMETPKREEHDVERKTNSCESAEEFKKQEPQSSVGFFDEEPCSSNEAEQEEEEPSAATPRPRPLSSIPRPPGAFRPHVPSFFGNHSMPPRNRTPLSGLRPPPFPPQHYQHTPPFYGGGNGTPRRATPRGGFRPPPPPWRGPLPNHQQSRFF